MRRIILPGLAAALLIFGACGSSAKAKASSVKANLPRASSAGGSATASASTFCQDYGAASIAYSKSSGDVSDPSFYLFMTILTKAQSEAPAAIKNDVTGMLNEAKNVQKNNGTGDLTSYSEQISSWADSNCP